MGDAAERDEGDAGDHEERAEDLDAADVLVELEIEKDANVNRGQ